MATRSVLIIDDDPDTRDLLITVLSRHGFNCITASNGEEGIGELTAGEYDAVLLDLLMPKINGFELLRHIQATRRDLLTRVIILTAASEQTLRYFNSASVFALLHKPTDATGVLEVVRACVNGPSSQVLRSASSSLSTRETERGSPKRKGRVSRLIK